MMKSKCFIIGNGFDLAHNLPTKYDPDFKNIARKYEQNNFWDLYQSRNNDIWSDFENLLGCPDFNSIEEIFNGYEPDYFSDRESYRDSIIYQVALNGHLQEALNEFANNAEESLSKIQRVEYFDHILVPDGYYISFNYTHTLEHVYGVPCERILHIHGEVGESNLELGYPKGSFNPEMYSYDPTGKGRGLFVETPIEVYIGRIEDYYSRTAYEELLGKCKAFSKEVRVDLLEEFLDKNHLELEEIIVYGHSCAIDFVYFNYLNTRYSHAHWTFYVKGREHECNVKNLIKEYSIGNVAIIKV